MRDYIVFERPVPRDDTLGNPVREWAQLTDTFGELNDTIGAREGVAAFQEFGNVTCVIYTPWTPKLAALTNKDRARIGARVFDIRGVLGIEGRSMLTIPCDIHEVAT